MSTVTLAPQLQNDSLGASIQQQVVSIIDDLFAQLPNPERLTSDERRGIIARYTAVLEGNFIYWMTATSGYRFRGRASDSDRQSDGGSA